MEKIRIKDTELNVFMKGEGLPVLFVHGFPFDHRLFLPICDRLSEVCQCIVPDLRGFGGSELSDEISVCTMERYAEDLAELLDALGIKREIFLCGLSMGGYIAMEFARKYEDRLARLILCSTRTDPDTEEEKAKRLHLAETVGTTGMGPIADSMIPNLLCAKTREFSPSTVDYVREMIVSQNPKGVAAAARGMAQRKDTTELLKTMKPSLLFISGQEDRITSPERMCKLAKIVPDAGFFTVEDCAHLGPLEFPLIFGDVIRFSVFVHDLLRQDMYTGFPIVFSRNFGLF
ncbi:MAG: alpha/beta fold hydrolase [Planctomycetia bacterium]|nr:alpha/beta fold hydrolase [Planctomycetia bacterium]